MISPIMEASQEDTGSSVSSGSPSQIGTMKFQQIPENLGLTQSCTNEIMSDAENIFREFEAEGLLSNACIDPCAP